MMPKPKSRSKDFQRERLTCLPNQKLRSATWDSFPQSLAGALTSQLTTPGWPWGRSCSHVETLGTRRGNTGAEFTRGEHSGACDLLFPDHRLHDPVLVRGPAPRAAQRRFFVQSNQLAREEHVGSSRNSPESWGPTGFDWDRFVSFYFCSWCPTRLV